MEAWIGEKYGEVRRGGGGGVGRAGDLEESLPNILGVGIKFPRSPSIQGYGLIRYMHCTHTYISLLWYLNWTLLYLFLLIYKFFSTRG